jgi:hypothetical protein
MQKEKIKELQKSLKQESDINKEIQNLIADAVIDSITTTGSDHHGNRQCKFLQDQAEIGWQQVFRGRIARAITKLPSNKQNPESGGMKQTRWPRNMIRTIWDTFLILWNQRNNYVHGVTITSKTAQQRKALEAQVTGCFKQKDLMGIADRNHVFTMTQDELMAENPNYIKAWVKLATRIIRTCKKENKQRLGSRIMMEQYLTWNPPDKTKKRLRKGKQHLKQDLKPD